MFNSGLNIENNRSFGTMLKPATQMALFTCELKRCSTRKRPVFELSRKTGVVLAVVAGLMLAGCDMTVEDVEDMTDKQELLEVINGSYDSALKIAAIKNIHDPVILTDLALTGADSQLRTTALSNIRKVKLLEKIALNTSDEAIRRSALLKLEKDTYRISSDAVLKAIVLNSRSHDLRRKAINRIRDEEQLIQLIESDRLNGDNRLHVESRLGRFIKKTKNEKAIVRLWRHTNTGNRFAGVLSKKITRLLKQKVITDEQFLRQIARGGKTSVRNASLAEKQLTQQIVGMSNQARLTEIARNEKLSFLRSAAVRKLQDQDIITRIAQSDASAYVRKTATGKINNEDMLVKIAQTDPSFAVRKAAAASLLQYSQPAIPYGKGLSLSIQTMLLDKVLRSHYGPLTLKVFQQWFSTRYESGYEVRVEKLDIAVTGRNGKIIAQEKLTGKEPKFKELFKAGRDNINRAKFSFHVFCKKLLEPLNADDMKKLLPSTRDCKT